MDGPTENMSMPFTIKDCALITRMAGVDTALNLRELRERVHHSPLECLFHHFCETVIRPTFDDPEFRNDFAVWAAHDLRDRVLAERLGIINPYMLSDLEELRQLVIEVIDDRLAELPYIPSVQIGDDFRFMQAVTVVFDAGLTVATPQALIEALPQMSLGSVYFHFVEARRRTPDRSDDFTAWLADFGAETRSLMSALRVIDFYHMSLPELKEQLIRAVVRFHPGLVHA